jgi:ribokinase
MNHIVIVGSLNLDFVVQVEHLPQRGETIPGDRFVTLPGGKGANQACAVGRLAPANTAAHTASMIGCIGMDVYGAQLQESLRAAGVNHQYVRGTIDSTTGITLIVVATSGQNQIVVVPGANDCLRPAAVIEALTALRGSHLLLQLETPLATVTAAAQHARAQGMTVMLDPAPARSLPVDLLQAVSLLTPNESEALHLLGESGDHIALADAPDIARHLLALGSQQVILKLGAQGAYWFDGANRLHCAAQAAGVAM